MENPFRNLFSERTNKEKGYIEHLKEKIRNAENNALEFEEFNEAREKFLEYSIKEYKKIITDEEKEVYEKLISTLDKSTIATKSPEELANILKQIGLKDSTIKEIVEHEKNHTAVAKELGAINNGYECTIYKHSESPTGYAVYVDVDIDVPKEWDTEMRDAALKKIIIAPEENGGELSLGDKELISKIFTK